MSEVNIDFGKRICACREDRMMKGFIELAISPFVFYTNRLFSYCNFDKKDYNKKEWV